MMNDDDDNNNNDTTTPPSAPVWEWSDDAKFAFIQARREGSTLQAALNAALLVDGAEILRIQVKSLVDLLAMGFPYGERRLVMTGPSDTHMSLAVDRDLIEFVLFNRVPEGVHQRWADEAAKKDDDSDNDDVGGRIIH